MNKDIHRLQGLFAQGEGLDLEFKACRDPLPKSLYETLCAFLNRHGGAILLGVQDDGLITGFERRSLRDHLFREIDRADELGSSMRKIMLSPLQHPPYPPDNHENTTANLLVPLGSGYR